MRDIPSATRRETTQADQSARVDLWEFDLTSIGGERYFFCNETNQRGEPVIWQSRAYPPYPIQCTGVESKGKGVSNRPTLALSNLFGLITGMAEDMQGLVGATVVRRQVYAKFLDAVNFPNGNPDADPEQEVVTRYVIEQLSQLTDKTATFVLSLPIETDGALFPGRIMLADVCPWGYRSDECGYTGPPVADVFDKPTSDVKCDMCSKSAKACDMRSNIASFGGFLSINKLSQ
ncbi:phage minor tail protein L [Edwardsiella tarda]|uniref:phage minor tail protein L n=1 Tax=Edwardsiella tarda TaxID=636 RepID=UPI002445079B|nr:phage minor tail protein L [Edwardsiella tarda]WGE30530.1 phage minor tail protein L [Edwardsiella tarda]